MRSKLVEILLLLVLCGNGTQTGNVTTVTTTPTFQTENATSKPVFSLEKALRYVEDLLDGKRGSYRKNIRPDVDEGPTNVVCETAIDNIFRINDKETEMHIDLQFRMLWDDKRLEYSKFVEQEQLNDYSKAIILNPPNLDKIWQPDMMVQNTNHKISARDFERSAALLPSGTISLTKRLPVKVYCSMCLAWFPFDQHSCELILGSFAPTISTETKLQWIDPHRTWPPLVKYNKSRINKELPEFNLIDIRTGRSRCHNSDHPRFKHCLSINVLLQREQGHFLSNTYVPTSLVVILSWLSFYLSPAAAPARTSIGVITVLTICTQASGMRAALPRVAYNTAMDTWMSVCLTFVFVATVEFGVVSKLWNYEETTARNRKRKMEKSATVQRNGKEGSLADNEKDMVALAIPEDDEEDMHNKSSGDRPRKVNPRRSMSTTARHSLVVLRKGAGNRGMHIAEQVDFVCRFIFPLAFTSFVIFYWLRFFKHLDTAQNFTPDACDEYAASISQAVQNYDYNIV